jgi:methylated-DNA-[protein]-cysteine S-methyltransferase
MNERTGRIELDALLGAPAPPVPPALHERLVERASREQLVDVAYRTIDTRIGALLLAASPAGLVRIAFEREGFDTVLAQLAEDVGPRVLLVAQQLDEVARQLDAYLRGDLTEFDLTLDLRLARGFRREVLEHLRTIGYGHTESYATAARGAGRPAAVRAAASACSHNPIPLVIPCHRVVRSDGSPGKYGGGPEVKRDLLAMEASR